MEYNGINYNFTREEVEAVAELLKYGRLSGIARVVELSKIVVVAFNRQIFKQISNNK